jgi:hypothetical protein
MAVVTECVARSRRPSVLEVLRLMDAKEPRRDLRYADAHSELCDHGITDILDVYTYPVQLLAPLGNLGRVGVHRLRQFTWEKVLKPLTYSLVWEKGDDNSVVEVDKDGVSMREVGSRDGGRNHEGDSQSIRTRRVGLGREAIQEWVDSIIQEGEDMYAVDSMDSTVDVMEREASEGEYDAASSSSSQEL